MQLAVLLGLGALWVAVLLPDVLRRRNTRRSSDSIASFSRTLSDLGRPAVTSPGTASRPSMASNVISMASRRARNNRAALGGQGIPSLGDAVAGVPARPVARTQAERMTRNNPRPAARQAGRSQGPSSSRSVAIPGPAASDQARRRPQRAPRQTAAQRRQELVTGLGAAALLTFLATITFGGAWLAVHLLVDLLFVAYLGLILMVTKQPSARPVTYLSQARPAQPQAAFAPQRRTGTS